MLISSLRSISLTSQLIPYSPYMCVLSVEQILQRYDLVLIQEIRDASETAIHDLLNQLNE